MSIEKKIKKEIISNFSKNENDTGSVEVQIAIFSKRIENLTNHLKTHKHDNHTRRGLIAIVGKRKRLLSYLSKKNNQKYQDLVKKIGLRN
tara:strand:+ start:229 stop:498 length:270 start_codon:yes stop_codon:yes gene_type:complete